MTWACGIGLGHQGGAAVLWNQREHGIFAVRRVSEKIGSCVKLLEQAASEDCHKQVRGLQSIARTGNASWPDGLKFTTSIFSRAQPAKAPASRVRVLARWIFRGVIVSSGIGLPYLNHGIGDWLAIAIQDAAGEPYPLAIGFWAGNAGNAARLRGQIDPEERANGLRRSRDQNHISSSA